MVVLGLVAGLLVLAMPRLGGQNHQMRAAVRKLSAVTREIQTTAKLQGAVYRLVIDLGNGRDGGEQKFWIEKGGQKTVLTPAEMDDIKDPDANEDDEKKTPALFTKDTKLLKGDSTLPGDLRFEDVELRRKEQPMTEGKVYIHFFPQGLAEEAAIHLRGSEKLRWTLAVHPLTGKTNIMTEYVPLKEIGR